MTAPYAWCCGCSAEGRGETAAQRHSKTCPLMGRPWTNPDYPRPDAREAAGKGEG